MNLDVLFDNPKVEKLSVITEKMGETSGPTEYWIKFYEIEPETCGKLEYIIIKNYILLINGF